MQIKHTMAALAYQIINVNRKMIYTPINMVGVPGAGKTTGTQLLVHELMEKDPSYKLHWFKKDDLLNVVKILHSLPKYQDCILVFDDVSYLLDDIDPSKRSEILHTLTIVREILDPEHKKTRAILLLDFHYSFAIPKAFRQSNFSLQFSITPEERDNYKKRMGYSKTIQRRINTFVNLFESAFEFDYFDVKTKDGRVLHYETDRPFRPVLAFNFSKVHLVLSHEIKCEKCSPRRLPDKPDPNFWSGLVDKKGFYRVYRNLRTYTYLKTGKGGILPRKDAEVLKHIRDHDAEFKLPLDNIVEIFKDIKGLPTTERKSALIERLSMVDGKKVSALEQLAKEGQAITTEAMEDVQKEFEQERQEEENDFDPDHAAFRLGADDDDADDDVEEIE